MRTGDERQQVMEAVKRGEAYVRSSKYRESRILMRTIREAGRDLKEAYYGHRTDRGMGGMRAGRHCDGGNLAGSTKQGRMDQVQGYKAVGEARGQGGGHGGIRNDRHRSRIEHVQGSRRRVRTLVAVTFYRYTSRGWDAAGRRH